MRLKKIILSIALVHFCFLSFAYDLKIMATDNHRYELPGTYNSNLMFQNLGTGTIQNFQLKWSLDNVIVDSLDVNVLSTMSTGIQATTSTNSYYFSLTVQQSLVLLTAGDFDFKMWISKVHGNPDLDQTNDTIAYTIHIADLLPAKHVLLEKYCHTYCGPCYNGDLTTNELLTNYEDLSVVNIHRASSDPMSFADGNTLDNYFSESHPNFVFDRYQYAPHTTYWSIVWNGASADLGKRQLMKEGLDVSIISQLYDTTTRQLTVTLQTNFYANYEDSLAYNLWVMEDSILGHQADAPDPNNYYHMHVARAILGGPFGTPLIGSTLAGNSFEYTFNYTLPSSFNHKHIEVLGFVQRKDGSSIDVVNATDAMSIQTEYSSSVESHSLQPIKIFPNPAQNEITIECDFPIQNLGLYDLQGRLLLSGKGNKLNIMQLESSTYYLKVSTSRGVFFKAIEKL